MQFGHAMGSRHKFVSHFVQERRCVEPPWGQAAKRSRSAFFYVDSARLFFSLRGEQALDKFFRIGQSRCLHQDNQVAHNLMYERCVLLDLPIVLRKPGPEIGANTVQLLLCGGPQNEGVKIGS
ncbi:MAG: hypothetical protein WAU53_15715 [Rhodoplanes sp.]